jgi:hypothetical protein
LLFVDLIDHIYCHNPIMDLLHNARERPVSAGVSNGALVNSRIPPIRRFPVNQNIPELFVDSEGL